MNAEKLTSAREWLDAFCCAAAEDTDPTLLLHICAVLDAIDVIEHRRHRCSCAAANSHAWVNAFAARHFKKVNCLASSAPHGAPKPAADEAGDSRPHQKRGFVAAPSLTGGTAVTTPNPDGGDDAA